MAVAIGTVVLLVVWLVFVFSARNPDRWLRNSRDEGTGEQLHEREDPFLLYRSDLHQYRAGKKRIMLLIV